VVFAAVVFSAGFVWLPDATAPVFGGLAFAGPAEAALVVVFSAVVFSAVVAPVAAGALAVLDRLALFGAAADGSADGCFPSAAGGVSSLGSTPLIVSSAMLLPPRHAAMITSAEPGAAPYGTWRAPSTQEPLLSWFVL
jgi:hypothetical protein